MARPLCRDIFFYVLTTLIVWLTFLGGSIKISHSIAFICIYLFYIITVVGSGIIYTKYLNKKSQVNEDGTPSESIINLNNHDHQSHWTWSFCLIVSGRVKKLVFARTYFGQASTTKKGSIQDIDDDNYEGVVLRSQLPWSIVIFNWLI